MTLLEAMKQALEALEVLYDFACYEMDLPIDHYSATGAEAAITVLRQAIESAEKQEPVAWANPNDLQNFDMKVRTNGGPLHTVPLYTAPQKREWVELTDDEIEYLDMETSGTVHDFVHAIEDKLKEKNT